MASTWNIDLVRQVYAVVAEPNRDPRLGRNQEDFSEDPYMCARTARAIVEGVRGGLFGVGGPQNYKNAYLVNEVQSD